MLMRRRSYRRRFGTAVIDPAGGSKGDFGYERRRRFVSEAARAAAYGAIPAAGEFDTWAPS